MSLNIKNERTHQLIRELATIQGVSLVAAVTEAVEEKLAREKAEREKAGVEGPRSRYDLLMKFADECSKRMKDPIHSWEIGDYLYDEDGLPK
jgi:antitoxin VapB